ncbi:UNVERIFIED_CONTAM: hypothetical protein FKN15_048017 [Acipenser sinensis]
MAIQQADKLLKKHKDLYCAKVLKAIGLQRTGKQDEAFTLAQEVTALEPTDDNSLQALTILYREMHRPELVTKLYEVAVKKVPSSEEYHSHLFMAYARVGEYKKMQQVLKAIGLQRTGKQDEAFTLAQEVTALEPTDDNSLQALTILYREMHRPELVTKLYEVAVKKVPSSEEYHSHLFMAYARVGEYKKMQQAGMALYKIVPKNPYYFWSVMSLVMQAISARDEKLSKTMFLPLAERMVAKMVKEEKIEAEAEVQLYFMILERLGKYVEALEVVRGKLGEKLTSELQSRENKCMALYKKLDRWPECNALSRKLLLTNPDDWQFFLSYFDSLFHVIDESWSPPEEGEHSLEGEVESSVAQAIKFVLDRISVEEMKGSRQLRGPYLARLELIQRLRQRGSPEEKELGEPHELMFQYFEKFGDKPCCISDLKIFLDLLAPDQHVQFINRVMETVPLTAPTEGAIALPADTKALQRHLCVVQLARSLGLHHAMDREHKLSLIHELKTRYRHGLEFGKSSLKTELQYSDVYCLLAAHVLIDMWAETGEEWSLWQCLGLLEEGLIQSPSNAQFKLLLILIFCRLGAFEPVVDLYSSLDAKHVQHDTIGYLLTRYAESLGQFAASSQSCNFSLRFFHSNQKDAKQLTAFRSSSHGKDAVRPFPRSKYVQLSEEHRRWSLEEETLWLRIRSLTLRLIAALSTLNHTVEPNNSQNGVECKPNTLRSLLKQLHFALESGKSFSERNVQYPTLVPQYPFLGPPSTRLAPALASGCLQCQTSAFQFVSDIYDLDANGLGKLSEEHRRWSLEEETLWLRIRSLTLRLIAALATLNHTVEPNNSQNGVECKPNTLRSLLKQLHFALESGKSFSERNVQYPFLGPPSTRLAPALASGCLQCQTSAFQFVSDVYDLDANGLGKTISIVLWVSSYCANVLRPLKSNLQKKKKKKKEPNTATPPVFTRYQEYVASLQTLISEVLDHIKGLEITITALKLESLSLEDSALSEAERKFTKAVRGKVQSSYQHSLQEVGELLKKRLDTLKSLKI